MQGACVYAGNNSRLKAVAYRVSGRLIGYEKSRGRVKGRKDRQLFTIGATDGSPDITVMGPAKVGASATTAWDPKDGSTVMPGKLAKEEVITAEGKVKLRADSSAVFRLAAQGLREKYPQTKVQSFANVHDDEGEGGTESDSLNNFLEAMEDVSESCHNLDYFAYSGHGSGRSLPSAGLKLGSKRYTEFVEDLKKMLRPDATVIFYACSTGVIGGLSQKLSEAIPGITVFGHMCAGHGMTNPDKARCIRGTHESYKTLLGADYPKWIRCIKSSSDIWRRYPWMTIEEIRAEIQNY